MKIAALLLLVLAARAAAATTARAPLDLPRPVARLGDGGGLRLDWGRSAALAAGVLGGSALAQLSAANGPRAGCTWCEPNRLDLAARDALRWEHPRAAGELSDGLRRWVPLGAAAGVAWLAGLDGGAVEAVEDVVAVVGAVALTAPLTTAVKHGAGRLRPDAWAAGGTPTGADVHAFFSSHTSRVFAAAAAATQIGRLRGRAGWKWLAAATFAAAGATGWLRVAADQHWTTDVLAGAAAGTAMGLAVPPLVLRRGGTGDRSPYALAPAPGGLALHF